MYIYSVNQVNLTDDSLQGIQMTKRLIGVDKVGMSPKYLFLMIRWIIPGKCSFLLASVRMLMDV